MRYGIIYCLTNVVNGKSYIGQTINPEKRRKGHFNVNNNRSNSVVKRAIKKYGQESFTWHILETCSEDLLDNRECHWIATLDCMIPNGYNLRSGGSRGRFSEDSKRKMSESMKGRTPPNKDIPHTEETKRKISQAKTGKKRSPDAVKKTADANRGRKHSLETRKKVSKSKKGNKNPFYGKTHTPEMCKQMSETRKGGNNNFYGKKHTKETRAKMKAAWEKRRENPNQLKLF